jgi:hypothetical protein
VPAFCFCAIAFSGCAARSSLPQAPALRQLSVPPLVLIPNGTPVRIDQLERITALARISRGAN